MTDLAPIAVYDVHDRPAFDLLLADRNRHRALLAWMRSQALNPTHVYRLEIHLVDSPSARIYEYARDEQGVRYCGVDHDHRGDADRCAIARRKPYEVALSSLPPVPTEEP